MAITESDILNAVTINLGRPSESEYPTTAKSDALRRALAHYSQYKPLRKIGRFTTIAGQQNYDIASSYTYLLSITDVFYGDTSNDFEGFGIPTSSLLPDIWHQDLNLISNESLRVINDRELGIIQEVSRKDYHKIDDTTVALIPTPTEVIDVYFTYTEIKTVNDLKEREYQDIVDFTFLIAAMDLANKRHKILQVNEPGTGFVMFQGGTFLHKQVEETRKRLMERLGVNSLAIHD